MEPVTLKPSVGTLVLESEPAGAAVLIDGDARGEAPATIEGVCAGTHVVEFRSSAGRSVERMALEPGASLTIRGRVRPAFALLSGDAGTGPTRGWPERALAPPIRSCSTRPGRHPEGGSLAKRREADWFGVGALDFKPPTDLRDRLRRLADSLGRRAWRGCSPCGPAFRGPPRDAGAGSTEPDEMTLVLDQPDSVKPALDRLRTPIVLTRGRSGPRSSTSST